MPNTTERSQYRTGRTLSSGTHATLKEAIHIKTGRYYACKVISKDGTEGWEHLVRNEIAVLKRVQGGAANIIKLHDYFQTAHSVYLCLDLCIGGTLWDRIRDKGTYSEGKAVDLMRTLFIAIKHIHDAGVVHRDLRPENLIFRTADDAAPVMVAGFGLSRMMEDASHLPKEMEIASAPRYAAPEILSLLKNGEDKPVDVYGLGIIAYFVIAGCTPFERDTTQSEVQAVLAGQYKFGPDNKWDKVSANAREFIALCLAFDPIRRPKAREALAKPWIAQRLALRTSRRSSLLDLAGLRAFNPKRKWRILGLTIKALSRMHNLARPSTQKDLQQDSLHSYRHSKDLESKLGEADSSPVSSVYSFSDQGSSLRRDSISTMTTEDDTASIRDDDSSRESFIPTLAASDPQSLVAAHATVDPSLSEHHSDQQTPQEHPPPPSTQISSSTASSLSDQNFQEAVGTESNASPQSAADAHISTFVIYTPEKMDKISNDREVPITPEDIKVVESSFPDGGLVVSVHRPTEAEAWVEDHYEDNVFQSARSSGLVGPIAAMLSPDVPALVIFGSILDDRVLSFAKTLANVSGFAVMIRPIGDDPVSTFSEPDESEEPIPRMPSSLSSESEEEGGNGDENDVRVDFNFKEEDEAMNVAYRLPIQVTPVLKVQHCVCVEGGGR
ncbi:putative serine/threonine protein kinase [Mycena venus]|uniref:Putative serine/threonine protein kinase n=1 Tax=Mycena venus TaxID=2733690 RepID=A0A8H6XII1_9AGAR|nr:putative serine/threonine protein kinase [Mycena venus]